MKLWMRLILYAFPYVVCHTSTGTLSAPIRFRQLDNTSFRSLSYKQLRRGSIAKFCKEPQASVRSQSARSAQSPAAAPPPLAVAAVSWSRCQSPGLAAAEGASPAILRNLTTGCRSRGAEAGAFARPHDAFPRSSEPCRPWPLSDSCAEVDESSPFRLP